MLFAKAGEQGIGTLKFRVTRKKAEQQVQLISVRPVEKVPVKLLLRRQSLVREALAASELSG